MGEIIKKISAYDLLNALIPGGVLVYFLEVFGYLEFRMGNILCLITLAYVLGLTSSRIGSLVLEPMALRQGWITRNYDDYNKAQKNDDRLTALNTIANMYRTLSGAMVALALLALGTLVPNVHRPLLFIGYGMACFLLFFCGWIKQERYIEKRVDFYRGDTNDNH